MGIDRREFLQLLVAASLASMSYGCAKGSGRRRAGVGMDALYSVPDYGQVRLLHFTDCHAQLLPVYFREPSVNIGMADAAGRPPHLVGTNLLKFASIDPGGPLAHAFTHLDFSAAAQRYGRVGGFAHLKTLVDRMRGSYAPGASLLLDGGDTWQGSGTALWTQGMDMVGACNRLGVDIMTGHWEFTYQDEQVLRNLEAFDGEFVAQNIRVTEEALFDGAPAYDEDSGHAFKPYTVRVAGGKRIAVIGQAFPYTPVANPSRFIPNWSFGIRAVELQGLVDGIIDSERPDAIVLLSHNGMDVDVKLAGEVRGIDAILGGHTHDGVPVPVIVGEGADRTIVTNAGSNGKFLAVLDFEFDARGVAGYNYHLLPIFADALPADPQMSAYIDDVRAPYVGTLTEELGQAGELLYRRGNFNGSFDQVICDALRAANDAQISLSPGFRWGTSVLPGQTITMEHVLDQTCITYPETYSRMMDGAGLRAILEDVADNLFNPDPFYQQGGDMVRVGGLDYTIDPTASAGERISDMRLDDGRPVEAGKQYRVAGWATVGAPSTGPAIWDVVADYLRAQPGEIGVKRLNTPKLKNVAGNLGLS